MIKINVTVSANSRSVNQVTFSINQLAIVNVNGLIALLTIGLIMIIVHANVMRKNVQLDTGLIMRIANVNVNTQLVHLDMDLIINLVVANAYRKIARQAFSSIKKYAIVNV